MKHTHVAIGIASGIVVGVAIGMLFAPDKGSNIRKRMLQRGDGTKRHEQENMDDEDDPVADKDAYSLPPKDRDDYAG